MWSWVGLGWSHGKRRGCALLVGLARASSDQLCSSARQGSCQQRIRGHGYDCGNKRIPCWCCKVMLNLLCRSSRGLSCSPPSHPQISKPFKRETDTLRALNGIFLLLQKGARTWPQPNKNKHLPWLQEHPQPDCFIVPLNTKQNCC